MLIEVVFVITAGMLGLGLAATAPMLGAGVAFGRAVVTVLGFADALALGRADALALARGEVDGRGAAGAGNTGGSTKGDSMMRSTVRANPSDSARSSSASVAPNVARRRRCVTLALSLASGEIQSTSPASFGAAIPLIGGWSAIPGRIFTGGSVAAVNCGMLEGSRSCAPKKESSGTPNIASYSSIGSGMSAAIDMSIVSIAEPSDPDASRLRRPRILAPATPAPAASAVTSTLRRVGPAGAALFVFAVIP
jgi:hypothetical protein